MSNSNESKLKEKKIPLLIFAIFYSLVVIGIVLAGILGGIYQWSYCEFY